MILQNTYICKLNIMATCMPVKANENTKNQY